MPALSLRVLSDARPEAGPGGAGQTVMTSGRESRPRKQRQPQMLLLIHNMMQNYHVRNRYSRRRRAQCVIDGQHKDKTLHQQFNFPVATARLGTR
jgi:hypothetical protein